MGERQKVGQVSLTNYMTTFFKWFVKLNIIKNTLFNRF